MTEIDDAELERLRAAEEVCWMLILMMGTGLLPMEDRPSRDILGEPMLKWANIAAEQGLMHTSEHEVSDG